MIPNQGTATIKDVAARAGVSPATVSNVLNQPERVAARTRERVLAAVNEIGYVRNVFASRLRAQTNTTLGLVLVDLRNWFLAELAQGVQERAEQLGYTILLFDADRSIDRLSRHIDAIAEHRVAGALISGASLLEPDDRISALSEQGIRTVRVDESRASSEHCSVGVDDVAGGAAVTKHLLEQGCRRLVYVHTEPDFAPFLERLLGAREAVAAHPGAADIELHDLRVPIASLESATSVAEQIIALGADGAFCANDSIALGLLQALAEAGIEVPRKVAVAGYDDSPMARFPSVALTSVRQPPRLVGRAAAELVIDECSNPHHVHQHVTYHAQLVSRATSLHAPFDPAETSL